MLSRREFLKRCGGLLASVVAIPVPVFIPPREPFVRIGTGLDNLYSHLGVLPASRELDSCEGRLLKIGDWDGTGFPCLVQNACTTGNKSMIDLEAVAERLQFTPTTSTRHMWHDEVLNAVNGRLSEFETACRAMIECTGGSQHWNGETHAALKLIEAALENNSGPRQQCRA